MAIARDLARIFTATVCALSPIRPGRPFVTNAPPEFAQTLAETMSRSGLRKSRTDCEIWRNLC